LGLLGSGEAHQADTEPEQKESAGLCAVRNETLPHHIFGG
jgi:hypothetical protein